MLFFSPLACFLRRFLFHVLGTSGPLNEALRFCPFLGVFFAAEVVPRCVLVFFFLSLSEDTCPIPIIPRLGLLLTSYISPEVFFLENLGSPPLRPPILLSSGLVVFFSFPGYKVGRFFESGAPFFRFMAFGLVFVYLLHVRVDAPPLFPSLLLLFLGFLWPNLLFFSDFLKMCPLLFFHSWWRGLQSVGIFCSERTAPFRTLAPHVTVCCSVPLFLCFVVETLLLFCSAPC